MQNYYGVIIEESLENKSVLKDVKIISTKIEVVTPEHDTPWLNQWTLHAIEVPHDQADIVAQKISQSLERDHEASWYADFKNNQHHYIIYRHKIFKATISQPETYQLAYQYGLQLGIPEYQLIKGPEGDEFQNEKKQTT